MFIDLLTYNDLEMLKNRKARKQPGGAVNAKPNNKRYLILTYAVEFDRSAPQLLPSFAFYQLISALALAIWLAHSASCT